SPSTPRLRTLHWRACESVSHRKAARLHAASTFWREIQASCGAQSKTANREHTMITVSQFVAVSSIALALTALYSGPATAQNTFSPETVAEVANGSTRTDSRILYHNGWV